MDMSYAIIPTFGGEFRRLYRETQMAYIISDQHNPSNHPIYVEEKELGSSMLDLTVDDNNSSLKSVKNNIFKVQMSSI